MKKSQKIILTLTILSVLSVPLTAGEMKEIKLKNLDGQWEGVGEFLIPITNMTTRISGKADFKYDKKNDKLRTSLTGEKLFFNYNDSGYLTIDPVTDSVSWEVWDNSGKHAVYHGRADSNVISGERLRKKDIYRVYIEQVTMDSIDFKLTITQPDGDVFNKAVFYLWRKK